MKFCALLKGKSMYNNKDNFSILDCTLRDGGYVNDWKFSRETFDEVCLNLQLVGIDTIEVGILGKREKNKFQTKFQSMSDIPKIERIEGSVSTFTAMLTYSDVSDVVITERVNEGVEGIRLAFFKTEYKEALKFSKELINKGYEVYLQAMATFMYSTTELLELIELVNDINPFSFYLVDSFGTLYPEDVVSLQHIIHNSLEPKISLGFHAHNNMQMALCNSIIFLELKKDRKIFIDASIFGMGRGAGNVNLELLLNYLNKKEGCNYDTKKVLDIFYNCLEQDYRKYYWGYSGTHFLTAQNGINSVYIWYLNQKGIQDFNTIYNILTDLPLEESYTLKKDIVDKLILKYSKEGV